MVFSVKFEDKPNSLKKIPYKKRTMTLYSKAI